MLTCVPPNQLKYRLLDGWNYRVKSVSHPTEPANYTGSYTAVVKGFSELLLGRDRISIRLPF
jgi:hypothetical protein